MRKLYTICLLIVGLIASPALAQFNAQQLNQLNDFSPSFNTNTSSYTNPDPGIELEPAFPQPGEEVTARLASYNSENHGSTITWVFDGQVVPEAKNRREATFTAGASGATQEVQVILNRPDGAEQIFKSTIEPVYLDLIIEPQTRAPHFYRGRSLPSIGSMVNATALISGDGFRNPDLVYTWQVNRTVLRGGPLRGQNQISFAVPQGRQMVLSVEVTELDGNILARRAVQLPSVSPEVRFYGVSTLYGIDRVAADTLSLVSNSAMVRAEPYHLDSRTYNDPDIIEWEINGRPAPTPSGNPYEVTLERVGGGGNTTLNFHVRDTEQILQGAEGSARINF